MDRIICLCGCLISSSLSNDEPCSCSSLGQTCAPDHSSAVPTAVSTEAVETAVFNVSGMTCSSCVTTIENFVSSQNGVKSVRVNLLSGRAAVEFCPSMISKTELLAAFGDIGYDAEEESGQVKIKITGMTCASCSAGIEAELRKIPGITSISVSALTGFAVVGYRHDQLRVRDIVKAIESMGYTASLESNRLEPAAESFDKEVLKLRRLFLTSLIFAIPSFFVGFLLPFIPEVRFALMIKIWRGLTPMAIIMLVLATPVQFWLGMGFHQRAIKALRHRSATMDVLVSLGTNAAYFYSVAAVIVGLVIPEFESELYFETAVLLIAFILLGKFLESIAKGKTSDAIKKLLSLQAPTSILVELDMQTGLVVREETMDSNLFVVGDIFKVLLGRDNCSWKHDRRRVHADRRVHAARQGRGRCCGGGLSKPNGNDSRSSDSCGTRDNGGANRETD